MPSSSRIPEPGLNPLAPVAQLAHWLASTTIHIALGYVIGVIAARLLRSRHLHWSWAVVGLALVLLVQPALASATATLDVAALGAVVWGRRWHREDVEAGSDLAALAAGRRGPLDWVRSVARRTAFGGGGSSGAHGWFRGEELIVGRDENSRSVSIPLGGTTGGTHTLVLGATGSGKTVTQTLIATRAIEHGMGAIVIDPKGDTRMCRELRHAAQAAGRPFIEWAPNGPSVYNPYARGSASEIADKALAGERFTEPHYLRLAQRYLGHVVRALRAAELDLSLPLIVQHMDPGQLEDLVRSLPEARAQTTHDYLDSLTTRQQTDLAGVRDRLAILAESDVGRWLDPRTGDAGRLELLEAVQARAVVYFKLESDSRPLLTQMLGAAIVQDLQATVAALQGRPISTLVVIDEFSAVAAEQVVRLFRRARSAGFSLLLGTQELSDLRLQGRERLLEEVMGNLSALIAHRQVVPDSSALIASLAGTKGAWRASRNSDGRSTRTRVRESVLDSNEVMRLRQGWAAVIVLDGGGSVRLGRIFSPGRRS